MFDGFKMVTLGRLSGSLEHSGLGEGKFFRVFSPQFLNTLMDTEACWRSLLRMNLQLTAVRYEASCVLVGYINQRWAARTISEKDGNHLLGRGALNSMGLFV